MALTLGPVWGEAVADFCHLVRILVCFLARKLAAFFLARAVLSYIPQVDSQGA